VTQSVATSSGHAAHPSTDDAKTASPSVPPPDPTKTALMANIQLINERNRLKGRLEAAELGMEESEVALEQRAHELEDALKQQTQSVAERKADEDRRRFEDELQHRKQANQMQDNRRKEINETKETHRKEVDGMEDDRQREKRGLVSKIGELDRQVKKLKTQLRGVHVLES